MSMITNLFGCLCLTIALLAIDPAPRASAQESPPPAGVPKDFILPEIARAEFENGLKASLVEFGQVPKVTIRAVVRVGNLDEGDRVWLADITGDMMKEGAAGMDAAGLARTAGDMGGSLNVSVGPDSTTFSISVLSEFSEAAIGLLADLVTAPDFPAAELPRIKQNFLRNLSVARTQPRNLASEAFLAALYGEHPYGVAFPTAEQLQGYTIEDIRGFYEGNFGAARTHVYVGGQFDAAAVRDAVAERFGGWRRGPDPLINPPTPDRRLKVKLIDRPGAPQSTLYLGLPVVGPESGDYVPFQVTNTLLGGFFSSRITANIREDKGYTYSPFSTISNNFRASHWMQVADVTTEATGPALAEIFNEIVRLQDEEPSPSEMEMVKNYRSGIYILQNASRGGILGQLAFLDLHGLNESFLTDYVATVHALTARDLSEMARRYIKRDELTLVVVGDLDVVTKQVQALPQFEGIEIDIDRPQDAMPE